MAKVTDDADTPQSWVVEVNETVNEQVRRLMRKELEVVPVKPEFDIELKINGQSSDFDIEYGETLNFQLKLKNISKSVMNDLIVTALMDSDVIDRQTIYILQFIFRINLQNNWHSSSGSQPVD